jgi:hypothetical protein
VQDIVRATIARDDADIPQFTFTAEKGKIPVSPRPFQRLAIPYVRDGANLIIAAETGSGKTLVFVMAIFLKAFPQTPEQMQGTRDNREGIRAVMIVPTGNRQLVAQHEETLKRVARHLKATGDCFWGESVLENDCARQKVVRHGVAATNWKHPERYSDKRDDSHNFSRALIRVDSANRIFRITKTGELQIKEQNMFDRVQVIAIDEVDKVFVTAVDKKVVEALVRICGNAQIVSASATIVRYHEGLVDGPTDWLKSKALRTCIPGTSTPRPFYSIQTENVFPSSVFHLIVDLRNLAAVHHQDAVQLAWERMHTLKFDAFGPALIVWDVNRPDQEGRRRGICDESVPGRDPNIILLNERHAAVGGAVQQKFEDLRQLREGQRTGAIGNQAMTVGLDYPFKSVLISKNQPQVQTWNWATYTHASGRCGRGDNMLGISFVFICNPVRFDHCLQLHLPKRRHTAL